MKKRTKNVLGGMTSAAVLMSGTVQAVTAEIATTTVIIENEHQEVVTYNTQSNVQGRFSFNQNKITPADDVFNLFGTVVTGMCAKPDCALSSIDKEYHVNVGGKIAYSYTRDIKSMIARNQIMLCACATGPATVQAQVKGVPISEVLELSALDDDANTLVVKSSDGFNVKLPLKYVLEREAMLAYQIGDKEIPTGVQLWIPETVAKYFVRDVVELEVTTEKEEPVLEVRDESLQAEIAIMNTVEKTLQVGKSVTFEGYADDLGDAIAAVEFSLDDGQTWTSYETQHALASRWVNWHFEHTPTTAGKYKLSVRARTKSGKVSPLAANVVFNVVNE
jgi:DMSO/TMAO reductase YedYZ molybdopterin-dependent catalytic subunit